MSMALLFAAGLFVKSLANVARVDLGLNAENVVQFELAPELNGYDPARSHALFARLEEELAAQPGVTSVTAAIVPVLAGSNWSTDVTVQGFQRGPDIDSNSRFNMVGPNYFKTLGIPLLAGRDFTAQDITGAPKVAIVNERFLQKFKLGNPQEAIGKLMTDDGNTPDTQIIGVSKDAKYSEVKAAVPELFFRPYKQQERVRSIYFYVRTAADPVQFLGQVRALMQRLDADLPVGELRTLPDQVRQNVFLDRFIGIMSTSFAVLATLLAAVGLYGVLAYTVSQRTREIGLRMALGAGPGRVRGMVLKQVGVMTLIGAAIGFTASWVIARFAEQLLFGMSGRDPFVFMAAPALLAGIALLAGFIPAQRASRVDPMTALRYE
jgi:predicted permease